MNRVLEAGYALKLSGKEFIIKDIVGKGASSVTYLAEHGKTEHILKECNPLGIGMHRNETGELVADTELSRQKFEECLERFKAGADKQLSFRLTEKLKNPTSNIQDIYYTNGTAYIDMTYSRGKTYDKEKHETLYDLFRRMKALTQIVGHYHKLGYLHLDIKPQNIYTIPETPEMVMMFDFDSVTSINDISSIISSSYTDMWAAPEQKLPKYRCQICEATDLFAIGEIIFFRLFGKHSAEKDRYSFSQYKYPLKRKKFENVNPSVLPMITELLHKTLSYSVKKRYQNAEQLALQLDKIIEISNPKEPFLKNSLPNVSGFFTGRDAEIEEIHRRLQENNVLFLSGIGGIGKSELAKHYAEVYKDSYDAIIFAPFVNDIQTMIADDSYVLIHNFARGAEEKPNEYFERKIKELAKLCNERTLIIVDNFDTTEDENLDKLLSINCKMLITTRRDFSGFNKQQMCVDKLHINSEIRKIFDTYYKVSDEEESACVDEIIELVEGHTMSVELIAKQIEAEWATANEILDKLKEAGISGIGESDVDSGKDNDFKRKSTYDHIKALFDLSVFEKSSDKNALYVLANLSLVPHTGIDRKLFAKWCELEKYGGTDCVNKLIKNGWIREEKRKEEKITVVSLHPLVSDILHKIISMEDVAIFLSRFAEELTDDTGEVILQVCSFSFANTVALIFLTLFQKKQLIPTEEEIHYMGKIGDFFFEQGLFDSAERCFCIQQEHYRSLNLTNAYLALVISNSLALLYDKQGELYGIRELSEKALCYLKECLLIVENPQNNMTEYIGTVSGNIGSIYHTLKDYENAENYYKKALEYSDRYNFYANLGVLYESRGNYTKALEMHQEALKRAVIYKEPELVIALIEHNMATSYKRLGLLKDAVTHCENALHIREKNLDPGVSYDFAITKSLLGQIYVETGVEELFSEAERLLSEALISLEKIVGSTHEEYQKARSVLNSFSKKD